MPNCVMKYNKNNIYSGINIYNKLDKDIQEIIDNYLIQWRREENEDFYFQDSNSPIEYRRFISDFHLHYKFNNPIMKKIFMNDKNCYCYVEGDKMEGGLRLLIMSIMDNCLNSNSLYDDDNIEAITDLLHISTDTVITDIFEIGYNGGLKIKWENQHNMDIFEKICKQMDRNPIEVINAVISFQNEVMGEIDISTNDKLDFAKISVWFINEYIRAQIINQQE